MSPSHPRKEIRAKFVELLKAAAPGGGRATSAGDRVYDSRDLPIDFDAMPAVLIYTVSDTIDPEHNDDDGMRHRTMVLRVECYDMGDSAAEGVDQTAWEVESVVNAFPTLDLVVEEIHHIRTDISFAKEGDDAMFVAGMTFEVTYWTNILQREDLPPLEVLLGFDPDVGRGNETKYYREDGSFYDGE